ncbi:hypothetical protein AtEden1_Chr5g0112221 [Arabidopsis thaliana]
MMFRLKIKRLWKGMTYPVLHRHTCDCWSLATCRPQSGTFLSKSSYGWAHLWAPREPNSSCGSSTLGSVAELELPL